ncbi:MAG TPA: AraC family transcriptional regulator [Ilumatobacter sp.]|nr:AraC family transcriptional regulator [Ilumatobacter sp.]
MVDYLVIEFDLERVTGHRSHVPAAAAGFGNEQVLEIALRYRAALVLGADPPVFDGLTTTLCERFIALDERSTFRHREQAGRAFGHSDAETLEHYVNDNLAGDVSIDSLAAVVGMSPRLFRTVFKNTFGRTPAQYVIDQRVRRAQWLMRTSDEQLSSLAARLGFSSHSHFGDVYRRRVGESPRGYRRLVRSLAR